jgi:hypothetical protein
VLRLGRQRCVVCAEPDGEQTYSGSTIVAFRENLFLFSISYPMRSSCTAELDGVYLFKNLNSPRNVIS